jgi:hypothetical protein
MKRVIDYLKSNKLLLGIIAIVILLIALVVVLNGDTANDTTTTATTQKSSEEVKLIGILQNIKGVGDADVLINETDEGQICGVVIVCSGADNIMTKNDILNAVSTALNIQKNIIAIYAMN